MHFGPFGRRKYTLATMFRAVFRVQVGMTFITFGYGHARYLLLLLPLAMLGLISIAFNYVLSVQRGRDFGPLAKEIGKCYGFTKKNYANRSRSEQQGHVCYDEC